MIETAWQAFKHSVIHLMYPSHCLHCHVLLSPADGKFCQACLSLLELIDPIERCERCFAWKEESRTICRTCRHAPSALYRVAAAFDYIGPAASLIKALKYGNQPYLATGAGSFLFAQFDRLNWPLPDLIVPVPLSITRWMQRGYNQSEQLAQSLGKYLNVPVWKGLKRKHTPYNQASSTTEKRKMLVKDVFYLKRIDSCHDKVLLIIDDVMTTGQTLQCCASALLESCPSRLYALTLCRALSV